jgi:hypothetical protein
MPGLRPGNHSDPHRPHPATADPELGWAA